MKTFCKKLVKYPGKLIKYAILAIAILIAFLGVTLFITTTIDKIWPPKPIKEVMAENYELHKEEIIDLTNYFKSITDGGKVKAMVEFSWGSVDILCANGDCFHSSSGDKDDLHKIASELGWNDKTLKTLKKKLKAANCISITNKFIRDGLFDVGFKRGLFEMYTYTIFDKDSATDLTEEEFKKFTNNCDSTYYKDNIVFSFQGGGTGPQCFIDSKKK
jgi:hypothetical protein